MWGFCDNWRDTSLSPLLLVLGTSEYRSLRYSASPRLTLLPQRVRDSFIAGYFSRRLQFFLVENFVARCYLAKGEKDFFNSFSMMV